MNLKKLAVAGAAALAVGASFAASPSVTLGSDGTLGFGMGSVTGPTFEDTWTINAGSYTGVAPFTVKASVISNDGIVFESVTLQYGSTVLPFTIGGGGGLSFASLTGISAALPWTLVIKGATSGVSSYGGQISATPVPEPETYALMLAGLGAIGYMARRRKV